MTGSAEHFEQSDIDCDDPAFLEVMACFDRSNYFADLTHAAVTRIVFPHLEALARDRKLGKVEIDGMDLQSIRAWNSLMPDFIPSEDWITAGNDACYRWIVFSNLFEEHMQERYPLLMSTLTGRPFESMEGHATLQNAAKMAVASTVVEFLRDGDLAPAMTDTTRCYLTGEYLKLGFSGFRPVIVDVNDNPVPFTYSLDEESSPQPGP